MAEYLEKEALRRKMYDTCNDFCPNMMCKLAEYFENDLDDVPTVELQTIKDVVVPNLEKHNIKRAYPDMTDREVAAYILGFTEHEKLNMGHCYIDNEGYERCSVCNEHETGMRYFSFCPRCGVQFKH